MLDEFGPQSVAVNTALGQDPGSVDTSTFVSEAKGLADKVFTGTSPGGPAAILARKEAYDFVVAYSRLNTVLTQTRAQFYAAAPADVAKEAARTTRLTGALNTYARIGDQ